METIDRWWLMGQLAGCEANSLSFGGRELTCLYNFGIFTKQTVFHGKTSMEELKIFSYRPTRFDLK